jgi:hypothetical protein
MAIFVTKKQSMKRIITAVAFLLSIFAVQSFRPSPSDKDLGRVNRTSGLYVFIESQPVGDYTVLGTVKKTGLVWNGKAKEMRDILVKRALKDYPDAEGIIFDDISLDHATVIKYK